MEILQCQTPADVAVAGANFVAARATEAIAERGQFTLALSGGSTPWIMLAQLAEQSLPWDRIKVFQVDERVAADGDAERNLVHIRSQFADRIALPAENLFAMPVVSDDLKQAARQYEKSLIESVGDPPVLDVVHLGLGDDGHTASLLPGDAVLNEVDHDVAITDIYSGRWRMTLTYSIINRARHILWLVTGEGKAEMLHRLIQGDSAIPAGRVSQRQATVVADAASLSRHIQN
jgi:6-phosphogluconolactonase